MSWTPNALPAPVRRYLVLSSLDPALVLRWLPGERVDADDLVAQASDAFEALTPAQQRLDYRGLRARLQAP